MTQTLRPGDHYDVDEWRLWLDAHGVDINVVAAIDISPKKLVVHRYDEKDGSRYLDDGDIAMLPPLVIRPLLPIPSYILRDTA